MTTAKRTTRKKRKRCPARKSAGGKRAPRKHERGSPAPPPAPKSPVSAVAAAKHRRHLALLEKMKAGRVLSARETRELERLEAEYEAQQNPTIATSQEQVARHFGVTSRSVRTWTHDPAFPQPVDGKWDLDRIAGWKAARDRKLHKRTGSENGTNWEDEKRKWQALLAKQKYEVESGKLIVREHAERIWSRHIVEVRTLLLSLPDKLALLVPADDRQPFTAEARRHVHDTLAALAQSGGDGPDGGTDE